jgi:hypothetical protein
LTESRIKIKSMRNKTRKNPRSDGINQNQNI